MIRPRIRRWFPVLLAALVLSDCAPKPLPPVTTEPTVTVYDQKMRWILQLEDERQLRGGGGDLIALLHDAEPRVRRRCGAGGGPRAVAARPCRP